MNISRFSTLPGLFVTNSVPLPYNFWYRPCQIHCRVVMYFFTVEKRTLFEIRGETVDFLWRPSYPERYVTPSGFTDPDQAITKPTRLWIVTGDLSCRKVGGVVDTFRFLPVPIRWVIHLGSGKSIELGHGENYLKQYKND